MGVVQGSPVVAPGGENSPQGTHAANRVEPVSVDRVNYDTITTADQLAECCRRLADAEVIAFDTEFVSEDTYWSQLCLIQVATADVLAVIDPLKVRDVGLFWEALAEGDHTTVAHASREELQFCLRATGRRPANLFDTQIAAGLVGTEYPAGYGALIRRLLGARPLKGETRTDWRRRPLSQHQIEYAVSDVRYLLPVYEQLRRQLRQTDRLDWMADEMATWQDEVEHYRSRPRWRKVSGVSGLSKQALTIVRELWHWREAEAERLNRPAKRILRDDLIVELARRGNADPKRVRAVRGLDRGRLNQMVPQIAATIEKALAGPMVSSAGAKMVDLPAQLNLLGQFLSAALTSICRRAGVAASLVGTASDVRALIAHRMGLGDEDSVPALATGWRAEVVGRVLDDLLEGKMAIRIVDPNSETPLAFEPVDAHHDSRD